MKSGVSQTSVGDAVDVRRVDEAAVRLERGEPDIVQHDVEDTRRAIRRDRLAIGLPIRHRILDIDVHDPAKWLRHDKFRSFGWLVNHASRFDLRSPPRLGDGGRRRANPARNRGSVVVLLTYRKPRGSKIFDTSRAGRYANVPPWDIRA